MVIFNGVWAIANGMNSFQCLGRVSRPAVSSRLYRGVAGQGRQQPENRQSRWPRADLLECAFSHATVSLSMPKMNDVMA